MDLFRRLSPSRLCQELVLLLSEDEPRRAVARMGELGLLRFIHPALTWTPQLGALLKGVEDSLGWYRLLYLDREMEPWPVYLMALLDCVPGRAVGETLRRLRVPGRQAEKIKSGRLTSNKIVQRLGKRPPLHPAEVFRLLEGLPEEALLFLIAKAKSESAKRQVSASLTTYRHVEPTLKGHDLKSMGSKPGPIYKKILERLRDARLNGEVQTVATQLQLIEHLTAQLEVAQKSATWALRFAVVGLVVSLGILAFLLTG